MVTSSLLHLKSDAFGSKMAPSVTVVTAYSPSVANRGAHKTLAGLVFQAHNGLKCHPMMSKCLIGHIHTSCHAQTMESLVLLWDNSHFSMLTSSFFAKTHKTLIFPSKNGGKVEVFLVRWALTRPPNRICSPPPVLTKL